MSLHIKHLRSIFPISLISFLNSNNELLAFTTTGKLFHMRELPYDLHLCHSKSNEFLDKDHFLNYKACLYV